MTAIKQVRPVSRRGKPSKHKSKIEDFKEENREIELVFWHETRPEGP
jgi:hypothetical protein